MKTSDFSFELPEELIAQRPPERRGQSRLLVIDRTTGALTHSTVADVRRFIPDGAVMVFNDSKVRKARMYGTASSGGRVEFLLTQRVDDVCWEAVCTKMRKQTMGKTFEFPDGVIGQIVAEGADTRTVRFSRALDESYFERYGHVPLPPYIRRDDEDADADRYQTVYARMHGSVAAPTAGLHFTDETLAALDEDGVQRVFVTLHVGMGTFMPVRAENVEDHRMHAEVFSIPPATVIAVQNAKREGRAVVAVGTTSVRTLESAWGQDGFLRTEGCTDIFITPGYRFKVVDHLFTNFHTPESTLLMLVSAFAGSDLIKRAYVEAVAARYRFFSYGDATLIM